MYLKIQISNSDDSWILFYKINLFYVLKEIEAMYNNTNNNPGDQEQAKLNSQGEIPDHIRSQYP